MMARQPVRSHSPQGVLDWITRVSKQKLIGLTLLFDLAVLWSLGLIALQIVGGAELFERIFPIATIIMVPILTAYILQRFRCYTIQSLGAFVRQVRMVLLALAGAFVLVMGAAYFANIDIMGSRGWLLRWFAYGSITLILFRLVVSWVVIAAEAQGELARRAVIVGGGKASEDLIARLEASGERSIRILGLFDDRSNERSPEVVGRYRKIGTFDELERFARENSVDLLIIALPPSAEDRILHLLKKLW